MQENLFIGLLGKKGAGKSFTWNSIFKRRVKTGKNLRKLYLTKNEYVKVFLISGSAEERKLSIEEILPDEKPRIVLCSISYKKGLKKTLEYFTKNNYFIYLLWLNPGYKEERMNQLFYTQGAVNSILRYNKSLVGVRDANLPVKERADEIKNYIYLWAKKNNQLKKK
jgi:ABC-type dipeptide/oligopeptide/nickel transport system ATPase component